MFLGIDLGTSSVKGVLIDEASKVIGSASSPLKVSHPHPFWSEQDPKDWWKATCEMIEGLQKNHQKELKYLEGIGLSGQMHGATLLDASHQVLRPAILWNDGRSMQQCHTLEQAVPHSAQITGNRIMPGFTAPKLLWVKENEPDIFKKTKKVLLPKDYIRFQMTGDFATDLSDASGTMWLDVGKRTWSEEMLDAGGLAQDQMPQLYEGSEVTGTIKKEIAKAWKIPEGTPVVAGGGDNAASAISIKVIEPGKAFLSLGTSGVYFVAAKTFHPHPEGGMHTMCHCLPGLWHHMAVHLSAAGSLNWFASKILDTKDFKALFKEAERGDSNVIFLPYLSGERTPHNDPFAKGVFFGMSHKTKRGDMIRAILEGVAFAFADGQDAMKESNVPIEQVSVIGGGARDLFWGKILASALKRELIYQSDREVGGAYGAALLASIGAMKKSPDAVCPDLPILHTISPDEKLVKIYEKRRKIYQEIYQRLREVYRNGLF